MTNQMDQYKKFEVTFTENNKKYRAVTRTVTIFALNEYQATMMTHMEFGSFKKTHPVLEPSNKIKIVGCELVKDEVVEDILVGAGGVQ